MSCARRKGSCARAWRGNCGAAKSIAACSSGACRGRRAGAGGELEVDAGAPARLVAAVEVVTRSLREPASVNALELLRWPGVLREDSASAEQVLAVVYAVFEATLEDLVAARAREGARLRELLEQRCAGLETLVAGVRARLPEVQARVRSRLDERLAELGASVDRERI